MCGYKAISTVVNTTTSALPAVTKVTGAAIAEREEIQSGKSLSVDISRKIGPLKPPEQAGETETNNEDCPEFSDDETRVLKVCPTNKGEVTILSRSPGEAASANNVRGRLRAHIAFWETINAPQFILETIRHGYKIPFIHEPAKLIQHNNNSAYLHRDFVNEAIQELLAGSRISEVKYKEELHVINPLSVSVQASGKKRLILDLREVNKCLYKQTFKFEDHKQALAYFRRGCFLTKFDLKSGYHHLDIFPEHRKYLGFAWKFGKNKTRYFMFNVLPFGLSTAPYIFTKLLRPLVKLWRNRGLHPVVYLDDGLNMEGSLEEAHNASHHTRGDLDAAGFIAAEEKTIWHPVQHIDWLGISWNSVEGCISICLKRIAKAKSLLNQALNNPQISARELASIVGSIISMGVVFGRVARIMTQN